MKKVKAELEKKKIQLKSLKDKFKLKKEMMNGKDLGIMKKTEIAINDLHSLKEEEKNLDREYKEMQMRILEIAPKAEVKKMLLNEEIEEQKMKEKEIKQEALDMVKESLRIYGKKNLGKILNNEFSK